MTGDLLVARYAIRDNTQKVKIFKNFKEKKSFSPQYGVEGQWIKCHASLWPLLKLSKWIRSLPLKVRCGWCSWCHTDRIVWSCPSVEVVGSSWNADGYSTVFLLACGTCFTLLLKKMPLFAFCSCSKGIYGGALLGVRSVGSLAFYTWDTLELIRRIEVVPKNIYWSENGELLAITSDESFFILRFSQAAVDQAFENKDELTEDGVEEAFDVSQRVERQNDCLCMYVSVRWMWVLVTVVHVHSECCVRGDVVWEGVWYYHCL